MPLYEYGCPAGHVTEKRVASYDVEVVSCACGLAASRSSVNRINFGGFASTAIGQHDFSQDYRRFSEASSEMDYRATRLESEGAVVKTPNFYKAAKTRARDLAAAGVTADAIKT